MVDHRRYPRDHGGILLFPVFVRGRTGEGICSHPDDRSDRERIHGGVRVEDDFRLRAVEPAATGDVKYLIGNSPRGIAGYGNKSEDAGVRRNDDHQHGNARWNYSRTRTLTS